MKIDTYKIFVITILLNSFVSVTSRLYPSSLPLGKVLGAILLLDIIAIYLNSLKRIDIYILMYLIFVDFYSVINSTDSSVTFENITYFTSTVLLLWKLADKKIRLKILNAFSKYQKYVKYYIFLIMTIVILGLFNSSCYLNMYGTKVYLGFTLSEHKLAGNMCLLMTLLLLYFQDKKFNILQTVYFAMPMLIIFMTASRTYLVSAFILLLVFYKLKLKYYKLRFILIPIVALGIVYVFLQSNVFEKFIFTSTNVYISTNLLDATSSGRLIWWKIDLNAFSDFKFIDKLFGMGHNFVYEINEKYYGMNIQAHNDIIQILLASGIIGLAGYVSIFLRLFKNIKSSLRRFIRKIPLSLLVIYILWNVTISGFYGAQQYVYSTVILILIITSEELLKSSSVERWRKGA